MVNMKFKMLYSLLFFVLQTQVYSQEQTFKLATAIQSNMVVQQNKGFKIWGLAKANEPISAQASWDGKTVSTTASSSGEWLLQLAVPKAKPGDFKAHHIIIKHAKGEIKLDNILIGEVWLCSGQSNMEMTMLPAPPWHKGVMDYETEIPEAHYSKIRLFKVKRDTSSTKTIFVDAKWQVCGPETVGAFSGVAYYFGVDVFEKLNIPVGLVLSAYGGASCQAFTAREVLEADAQLKKKYLDKYLTQPDSVILTNKPSLMYNKMIYPLINLSIKGILWYQGESNSWDRAMYTKLCTAMLQGWRSDFKQGDLPFYFVQMTPFNWNKKSYPLNEYAFFREAQEAMLKVKNTGMAITMDVGEPDDIHPRRKKEVGQRLAKIALHKTYGFKDVQYQGPQYQSHKIKDNKIVVSFTKESISKGLITKNGFSPNHFSIAGEDKQFYPAEARIQGDKVVVFATEVKHPVALRYAFHNYPVTNFQNKSNLPAVPFRTDNWDK